ncbi:MAG: DUF4159 domain-containing protein [Phycisphaerae bacterium]|nr:DUF4159 domain-containing protein [Tepidisphaeraceae bacterium]
MRLWTCVAALVVVGAVVAPASRGATPQQVEEAIKKAKEHLLNAQKAGNWEAVPARRPEPRPGPRGEVLITDIINSSQYGGETALITYALIAAGESPQEPRIAAALKWLATQDLNGTYSAAMRAQIWYLLPAAKRKEFGPLVKKDYETLIANMRGSKLLGSAPAPAAGGGRRPPAPAPAPGPAAGPDPEADWKGLYRYTANDSGYDHSASQFAVLGMWALQQAGVEVPTAYWQAVEDAWIKNQEKASGGWNYGKLFRPDPPVTPTMTAAGVATLFITQDYLHFKDGVECKGNVRNKAIDDGIAWLIKNFESIFKSEWPFYALYGMERIGLASGYKYLGTIDWYQRGADTLIKFQQPDGGWGAIHDTAFSLLFLVRGRAPVVMNKLEYAIDFKGEKNATTHWNQRPRDAANVTRWISRQFERELNWQIVNLKGSPEDLHDAPILYITGNQVLNLPPEDEAKLKEFVHQGGMILGNADCGHPGFANTFKKLGSKLFGGEFRELPANHVIYTALYPKSRWKNPLSVHGLTNGVREVMVLVPTSDPARLWQTGAVSGREEAWQFMANLFMYVSEKKDFRFKGESYIVKPDANVTTSKSVKLARLQYGAGTLWNPEPGGWERMKGVMHNAAQTALTVDVVKLGEGKLAPAEYKVAHLTAVGKFKLTDKERAELKAFVDGGGTLIADAAGGIGEAGLALESEIASIGFAKLDLLKQDHPLYAQLGQPVAEIGYRAYAAKNLGAAKGPRLKGAQVKDRLAVVYSSEDLSVGMVGMPIDGIIGYTPASATAVMRAVIAYCGGQ